MSDLPQEVPDQNRMAQVLLAEVPIRELASQGNAEADRRRNAEGIAAMAMCGTCRHRPECGYRRHRNGVLLQCAKFERRIPKTDHRMIMEEALGRKLGRLEFVHHVNGIHNDNRIENLCLCSPREHAHIHRLMNTGLPRAEAIRQIIIEKRFIPSRRKGKGKRMSLGEILRLSKAQ